MKSTKFFLSTILLFLLTACGSESNKSDEVSSKDLGSVRFSFLDLQKRTMKPDDITASRIDIEGVGPEGEKFETRTTPQNGDTFQLSPGTWEFTASSFNIDGISLAKGVASIEIVQDLVTEATITLEELEGEGTFNIKVSWPEFVLESPNVKAALNPLNNGESINIAFHMNKGTYEVQTIKDIPSGLYTLHIELQEHFETIRNWTEVVHIAKGQTTTGEVHFSELAIPEQNTELDLSISFDVNESFEIDTGSASQVVQTGTEIMLTAQPLTKTPVLLSYRWYVNGKEVEGENGLNFVFKSEKEGIFDIDVVATSFNQEVVLAGSSHTTIKSMNVPLLDSGQTLNEVSSMDSFGDMNDYNNDGHLDYIGSSPKNGLVLYLNDGNGLFNESAVIWDASFSYNGLIRSKDLNKDGYLDIVVGHTSNSEVSFVFYNREGVFDFYTYVLSYSQSEQDPATTISNTSDIKIYDENSDGWPDILILTDNAIFIYRNNGDGTFSDELFGSAYPNVILSEENTIYTGINHFDFNNDANQDLLVFTQKSVDRETIKLLRNQDGSYQDPIAITNLNSAFAYSELINIDGDDNLELIVADDFDGDINAMGISTYEINDSGDFVLKKRYPNLSVASFTMADMNMDGHLDMVAPQYSGGKVTILLNDGEGTFNPSNLSVTPLGPISTNQVVVGDIDGDNDPDLINCSVYNYSGNKQTTKVFINHTPQDDL